MDYLGPLLIVSLLHCAYAQYNWPLDPLIMFYNPATGQEIDHRQFIDTQMRSADHNVNDNVVRIPSGGVPCSCEDFSCRCCLGIGFGNLRQTVCVMIQYLWREFDVRFIVDWNDRTLASFDISPQNLPDFCNPLVLPVPIFTCLRASKIRIVEMENSLNLCVSLVFKLFVQQVFEFQFTCLRLGVQGVTIARDPYSYVELNPSKTTTDQLMAQPTNDKLQVK